MRSTYKTPTTVGQSTSGIHGHSGGTSDGTSKRINSVSHSRGHSGDSTRRKLANDRSITELSQTQNSKTRGSRTRTGPSTVPPERHHDIFDPVYETPSTIASPSPTSGEEGRNRRVRKRSIQESYTGESPMSGARGRKRKFTAFGVAQPRRERNHQVTQVRTDLFHTFEEVQDYLCDFRFKSQVIDTNTMPKFLHGNDFSRSNFYKCQNRSKVCVATQDGLIESDRWAMLELFTPLGSSDSRASKLTLDEEADNDLLSNEQEIVMARKVQDAKKMEAKEALFLRRGLLIQNDLYNDGYHFKHGTDAPEKNITRKPPADESRQEMIERVNRTFETVKKTPVHPTKKNLKPKRVLQLVPNRELWTHPYAQMKFDEVPSLPEERNNEIPPVIYKATPTSRLTAFAVFQHQKATGEHELDRSYAWDNQQDASNDKGDFVLIDWPENDNRNQVFFSRVSNKIRLKKLTARVQKQRCVYQKQVFGTDAIKINWREPTAEEEAAEALQMATLHPPASSSDPTSSSTDKCTEIMAANDPARGA